jgi:hypothetical protein
VRVRVPPSAPLKKALFLFSFCGPHLMARCGRICSRGVPRELVDRALRHASAIDILRIDGRHAAAASPTKQRLKFGLGRALIGRARCTELARPCADLFTPAARQASLNWFCTHKRGSGRLFPSWRNVRFGSQARSVVCHFSLAARSQSARLSLLHNACS